MNKNYQPGFWKRSWLKALIAIISGASLIGCSSLDTKKPVENVNEKPAEEKTYSEEKFYKLDSIRDELFDKKLNDEYKKVEKLEDLAGKLIKIEDLAEMLEHTKDAEKYSDINKMLNKQFNELLNYNNEDLFKKGIKDYFAVDKLTDKQLNVGNKALYKTFVAEDLEANIEKVIEKGYDRSAEFFSADNDEKTLEFIDLIDKLSNLLPEDKKYKFTKTVKEKENDKEVEKKKEIKGSLLEYGKYLYEQIKEYSIFEEGKTVEVEGLTVPLYLNLDNLVDGKKRVSKDKKEPMLKFQGNNEKDNQKIVDILGYAETALDKAGLKNDTNEKALYSFLIKKLINKKQGRIEQVTLADEVEKEKPKEDYKKPEEKPKVEEIKEPEKSKEITYDKAKADFDEHIKSMLEKPDYNCSWKENKEGRLERGTSSDETNNFKLFYDTLKKLSKEKLSDKLIKARLDAAEKIEKDFYPNGRKGDTDFRIYKQTLIDYQNFKSTLQTQPQSQSQPQSGEDQ